MEAPWRTLTLGHSKSAGRVKVSPAAPVVVDPAANIEENEDIDGIDSPEQPANIGPIKASAMTRPRNTPRTPIPPIPNA